MDIKVFEYFISQIFAAAIKTARTKEEWRGEGGEVSELGGKKYLLAAHARSADGEVGLPRGTRRKGVASVQGPS